MKRTLMLMTGFGGGRKSLRRTLGVFCFAFAVAVLASVTLSRAAMPQENLQWSNWVCVTGSNNCSMQYRIGSSANRQPDGNRLLRIEIRGKDGRALGYALYGFNVSYTVKAGNDTQSKTRTSRQWIGGTGGPLVPDILGQSIEDVALAK
jgi:hypothetical protein